MADQNNAPGTGFVNIAGGIGSLLTGLGGGNGIGDDIGNVICSANGNCQPQNVTYVQPTANTGISPLILLVGGAAVIVVLILVLKN